MKRIALLVSLILCFLSAGLANTPPPHITGKGKKSIDTYLHISIDRRVSQAKLVIPRSQLQQLRAELEKIDADGGPAAVTENFTRMQTLVSGTLLSLAFVFGGLWFVRSTSASSKSIAAIAILLVCGSVANLVYGNAGPPPAARSITGRIFTQDVHMYKQASGSIKLQVSDEVDSPELIVPEGGKLPATDEE